LPSPRSFSTPQHTDDEALVARCLGELPYNTTAYQELVRRHEPSVFRSCVRYLGSEVEAEEVTQDVFMRVFHGLPGFRAEARFRTWLFRIVRNECSTRYAKLKRLQERRAAYAELVDREETATSPKPAIDEAPYSHDVEATLAALSDEDRQVLVLRHVGELTLEELADTLGIKLSTAKMRLYRAQDRFRSSYGLLQGL
jgi:RNA polymerase sigma-70 factor (ECF subfamily)